MEEIRKLLHSVEDRLIEVENLCKQYENRISDLEHDVDRLKFPSTYE